MNKNFAEVLKVSIWSQLNDQKDLELILLKGHLIIEVILTDLINEKLNSSESIDALHLSFHKKVQFAFLLLDDQSISANLLKKYIITLNRLRNKLVHQLGFEEHHGDFTNWSNNVLNDFPVKKFSKFTHKTKIVHSFASISSQLLKYFPIDSK